MRGKGNSNADQGLDGRAVNIRSVPARAIAEGDTCGIPGPRWKHGDTERKVTAADRQAGVGHRNESRPEQLRLMSDVSASLQPVVTHMTDASLSAGRFADGDFHIGHAVGQAWSVLSRNFLIFFAVAAVAAIPQAATGTVLDPFQIVQLEGFGAFLGLVLSPLSQAVMLYGAFQGMRGKQINLVE